MITPQPDLSRIPVRCPSCGGRAYVGWESWGDSSSPWRTDNDRGAAFCFLCNSCGANGISQTSHLAAVQNAARRKGADMPSKLIRLISDDDVGVIMRRVRESAARAWLSETPGWTLATAIAPVAELLGGDTVAAMDLIVEYTHKHNIPKE